MVPQRVTTRESRVETHSEGYPRPNLGLSFGRSNSQNDTRTVDYVCRRRRKSSTALRYRYVVPVGVTQWQLFTPAVQNRYADRPNRRLYVSRKAKLGDHPYGRIPGTGTDNLHNLKIEMHYPNIHIYGKGYKSLVGGHPMIVRGGR
jgi:hypothetical protein